jgi:two-component system, NtrC family, response regulator GlrR
MTERLTTTVIRDSVGIARGVLVPSFRLTVTKGPDKGLQVIRTAERTVIGSTEQADLALHDRSVSAVHCQIDATPQGIVIQDLGSKNGVWLGRRRVERAFLTSTDELSLGTTVVSFKALGKEEQCLLGPSSGFGRLRGSSVPMRLLYRQLQRAAEGDTTVLLQGDSGTGKELAAEAIYSEGARKNGPLVIVDCGRLSQELGASELFGHEKGAFTGATRAHIGAFERAHGGTLFLDEVGELSASQQLQLLGALERRKIQRVGSNESFPIDVRVIAATHRSLEKEINQGTFRADLYFRLAVATIWLPPLKDRPEDIPELIGHFAQELGAASSLSPEIFERLCRLHYPGNVRELRNAVERALVGIEPEVGRDEGGIDFSVPYRLQKERMVRALDARYFKLLFESVQGNVQEAAKLSGLSRVHLYSVLQRLKESPP